MQAAPQQSITPGSLLKSHLYNAPAAANIAAAKGVAVSHKSQHHRHDKDEGINESVNEWGRGWKWIIWIGLALAVIAMVTYVLSFDDSLRPGSKKVAPPVQAAP